MRYIASTQLVEGMTLGQDIYDGQGRLLISRYSELKQSAIDDLLRAGTPGVYIEDEFSKDIQIQEVVSPEIRRNALKAVHDMFTTSTEGSIAGGEEQRMKQIISDLVDQLLNNEEIMYNMLEIKDYDDYTYYHSVNVAILSSMIGMQMGISKEQLAELMTAAMLHDIGKTFVDTSLLSARRKLREEEWLEMRRHPMYGYEYIHQNFNFSSFVDCAILEHHENFDGTGYPMGLRGNDIHLYARIIKAADVYDGMTSSRPYHDPMLPGEVIEYLMAHVGTEFDSQVVTVMLERLCVYPVGCEVVLSNGEHALVVENHVGFILRPTIKLLSDGRVINLMSDRDARSITIVKLLLR